MKSWLKSEFDKVMKAEARTGLRIRIRERRIPEEKKKIVEEAADLLRKYHTVLFLDLAGTPAKALVQLRKALEGKGVIKLIKCTLLRRAVDKAGVPNADELKKLLEGQQIAIFTNMNPFELKLLLDKLEIPIRPKPGMTLEKDIVVPPMRTELKPGPIMSLLGRFRIPTQVREGVIWIARETTIAKAGDTITPELLSLLDKLGIVPTTFKPKVKFAYDAGLIISGDQLSINLEEYRSNLLEAANAALNLASEIAIPEPLVIELSVRKAFARASALATEAGFVTPETAEVVVRGTIAKALALASALVAKNPDLGQFLQVAPAVAPAGAAPAQQPAEEKKEEEEEKKEE
ncbi:MAG: 50S ribosomal protein L10, partial [Crenarchaeota archaeon]|nr:50S ribosomal protein L10 [Thermoproteota archaeon]